MLLIWLFASFPDNFYYFKNAATDIMIFSLGIFL